MTSHGSYFGMDDLVHFFHARLNEHARRLAHTVVAVWRADAFHTSPPPEAGAGWWPGAAAREEGSRWWNSPAVGGYASWGTHRYARAPRKLRWAFREGHEWCFIESGVLTIVPDEELAPSVELKKGDLACIVRCKRLESSFVGFLFSAFSSF